MLEHLDKIQKIFNKLKVILGDQLTVIFSFQPKNPQIVPQSGLADEDFLSLGTKLLRIKTIILFSAKADLESKIRFPQIFLTVMLPIRLQ